MCQHVFTSPGEPTVCLTFDVCSRRHLRQPITAQHITARSQRVGTLEPFTPDTCMRAVADPDVMFTSPLPNVYPLPASRFCARIRQPG